MGFIGVSRILTDDGGVLCRNLGQHLSLCFLCDSLASARLEGTTKVVQGPPLTPKSVIHPVSGVTSSIGGVANRSLASGCVAAMREEKGKLFIAQNPLR